jgi:hypothetical protein
MGNVETYWERPILGDTRRERQLTALVAEFPHNPLFVGELAKLPGRGARAVGVAAISP